LIINFPLLKQSRDIINCLLDFNIFQFLNLLPSLLVHHLSERAVCIAGGKLQGWKLSLNCHVKWDSYILLFDLWRRLIEELNKLLVQLLLFCSKGSNSELPFICRSPFHIRLLINFHRHTEAEFKEFEPRIKYGWFHLKLY